MTGSLFIDVGAHFGYYSAMFSAELSSGFREGRILAVEPAQAAFHCLELTTRTNVVPTMCLNAAVGSATGTTTLYRGSGTCCHTYAEPGATVLGSVDLVTLESICRTDVLSGHQVAFLKIDVDGYEPQVLRGAGDLLSRHRSFVLMEFCPGLLKACGESPSSVFRDLCGQFAVYESDWRRGRCERRNFSDYDSIVVSAGDGIVDLLLCPDILPERIVEEL